MLLLWLFVKGEKKSVQKKPAMQKEKEKKNGILKKSEPEQKRKGARSIPKSQSPVDWTSKEKTTGNMVDDTVGLGNSTRNSQNRGTLHRTVRRRTGNKRSRPKEFRETRRNRRMPGCWKRGRKMARKGGGM